VDRLKDKVVVVTGAGSLTDGIGNGRAAAILFAREGAAVVVNDLDRRAAQFTLDAIVAEGGRGVVHVGDLTQEESARELVDTAVREFGRIDVLHNNVGIDGNGTVLETSVDYWDRVMAVNVKTMMLTSKFAVEAFIGQGEGGAIVNIGSIAALRPHNLTSYSASKGAVIALTTAMAADHAPQGIRVNCILPGPVYTPHVSAKGMSDELRERRRRASPLNIEGTGWDIAHAAVYLASDEARWVTGVVLPVDGGVLLTSASR
jgi:NAD(P)-dependent dehydrogenase (short-subunit alcohol dehydrogenase family)